MKNNKKRSPLKKESLRHAGQSLDERIEDAIYQIMFPVIIIIILWLVVIISWISVHFKITYSPWGFAAIAAIFTIYYSIKIPPIAKNIKNMKLGREGECAVDEALEELRVIGYKVYPDIVGKSFNIDNVVVGPAGVFTIEVKTWRKRVGANSQILYDGNEIKIDGTKYSKDPIKQSKGQMYWLEGFISNNAKIAVKVRPVVIFPGWWINKQRNESEVMVFNDKAFVSFIKNSDAALNQEQINLVASHLESYIRNN